MSLSSDLTENRSVHERVIEAVANANGIDPVELESLYATVDPEALDALFKSGVDGMIEFTYEGHEVVVRSDGEATVDGTEVNVNAPQSVGFGDDSGTSATGR